MKDEARTKKELIDELISLRLKVSKLEESRNKLRLKASELRKSDERLAMLSIATNDAIHDWDVAKNQLWCNEGMQKALGVPEVINDPWNWWIQAIHPDDRNRMVSGMGRLMKSDREFGSNEYRIRTAGGTHVYINHRIYILRDRKGKPVRMMGAATNITERKRSEEALRDSEERYRAFFETSRDCVFISSAEGRWIDLNDAAAELFGYANKEELKNVQIRDLYANPEGRDRFISHMREEGYVKEYPFDMRRKDGSVIHVLLTSVVWKDADGNLLGYRGTIRDVTEKRRIEKDLKAKHEELSAAYGQLSAYGEELRRKYNELLESQQALRESEKRYRELTDFLPISIFEVDTAGSIISFNRTALEVFRYNQEDFKEGMNALQFFPPAEWQRVGESIGRVMQGTSIPSQEFTFLRKDGSTFIGLIYASPKIHQNEAVGIRGTIIDITERKQAEEALRQS